MLLQVKSEKTQTGVAAGEEEDEQEYSRHTAGQSADRER